jgi:hypothetical protein
LLTATAAATAATTVADDLIKNPFFVDFKGGNLKGEYYITHKNVYVLCLKDDVTDSREKLFQIYNKYIDGSFLQVIRQNFMLVSTSNMLLYNKTIQNNAILVDKQDLISVFGENRVYNNSEIIVLMCEHLYSNVISFISLFSQCSLGEFVDIFNHIRFYNDSKLYSTKRQINNYIERININTYWSKKKSCNVNITDHFVNTIIDLGKYKDQDNGANIDYIDDMIKDTQKNNWKTNKKDIYKIKYYPHVLYKTPDNDSDKLESKTNASTKPFISCQSEVTKENLRDIINIITDEEILYTLVNSLLISKQYCHLVINDSFVLDKIKFLFVKYKPFYKYILGYTFLTLYLESLIIKTKSTKEHRYVFTIDVANKLPKYPVVLSDIRQNPYLTIPINTDILDVQNNCLSLYPCYNYKRNGVCNLETFKRRFNIFTTGNKDIDIFAGIPWDNFAVSGSVIPACLHNNSPLLDLFNNGVDDEHAIFNKFINTYYNGSDIDVMCNEKTLQKFILKMDLLVGIIMKNVEYYFSGASYEITPIVSACVFITPAYINEKIKEILANSIEQITTQQIIDSIATPETMNPLVKQYLYDLYLTNKQKSGIERIPVVSKDEIRFKLIDYDMTSRIGPDVCIVSEYVSDYDKDTKPKSQKDFLIFKVCETVRFKVKISCLDRPFEIFNIRTGDFFSAVARFHYSCVRAYYQGDNVYILPECVSTMMTNIVIPPNCYFAGARHPAVIHNKYIGRGWSILVNKTDKNEMWSYNDKAGISEDNNVGGAKDINHKLYNPLGVKTMANIQSKYITNISDVRRIYETECNYSDKYNMLDIFAYTALNKSGNTNVYHPEVAKLYYKSVNL